MKFNGYVNLSSENIPHNQWVEEDHEKEYVAREIVDILMQEIKLNALCKVSQDSENSLVEIIARLLDITMYRLRVEYEIEVTRAERQNIVSKNRKV